MPNLSTALCGARLENPTILASGYLGTTASLLVRVAESGAGAVTSKSCSLEPRQGHPNPVVLDWGNGLINAVGLSNPGVNEEVKELKEAVAKARVPVIASIFADSIAKFGEIAARISEAQPALLEVNISCPNVEAEFGKPFAADPATASKATEAVKTNTRLPVMVKLSPNVPDIKSIARAVVGAGADAISAINTVGPGMVIDLESGKPILANKTGGVSGPAIKPIAVRCVYDICSAVNVPVVGIGGISNGRDAVEMMMAGASAVGIGSAVYYRGLGAFREISSEIARFMDSHGYSKLEDFRGKALEG